MRGVKNIGWLKTNSFTATMDRHGQWACKEDPQLEETLNLLFGGARMFGGPEYGCPFGNAFLAAKRWFVEGDFRLSYIKYIDQNVEGRIYSG